MSTLGQRSSGSARADSPHRPRLPRVPVPHFGTTHPLASIAAQHCLHLAGSLGGVACGMCWELAIRDDERVVVEHGLPRELVPDPDFVDEIAVELACRGERVALTRVELATSVSRLATRRMSAVEIAQTLHIGYSVVADVLADLAETRMARVAQPLAVRGTHPVSGVAA